MEDGYVDPDLLAVVTYLLGSILNAPKNAFKPVISAVTPNGRYVSCQLGTSGVVELRTWRRDDS